MSHHWATSLSALPVFLVLVDTTVNLGEFALPLSPQSQGSLFSQLKPGSCNGAWPVAATQGAEKTLTQQVGALHTAASYYLTDKEAELKEHAPGHTVSK